MKSSNVSAGTGNTTKLMWRDSWDDATEGGSFHQFLASGLTYAQWGSQHGRPI